MCWWRRGGRRSTGMSRRATISVGGSICSSGALCCSSRGVAAPGSARTTLLRDMGQALSPFNAWMFLQGLETLPLRMREHCRNAETVAKHLEAHPKVGKVIFAGLEKDPDIKARNEAHMAGGWGGLVGFELKGGADAGMAFINGLKLEDPTLAMAEANMADGAELVELGTVALPEEDRPSLRSCNRQWSQCLRERVAVRVHLLRTTREVVHSSIVLACFRVRALPAPAHEHSSQKLGAARLRRCRSADWSTGCASSWAVDQVQV